jgi:serine/threonine-protein kinase
VIHRDLKPENVFIARTSGGKAVPKLLDFGVSKLARGDRAHTAMAAVLGTPDYMAPEQALGETEVDDRADQYSFALMVYECIAGRLPFESQNVVALLHEVARGVTVAPSRFVPEIAPEIDAILLRALSADPAARYPSVSELLAALLPFASARASLAYRTLLGERSDFASSRSGSTSRSEITAQFVHARAAAPTQDVTPAVRATPADRGAAEARNTPVRATPTPTPTPTPVAIDAELAPSGATAEAPSQRTSVPAPESERATRSRAQIGVLVALVGLLALGLAAWTVLVPSDPEHLPEVTTPAHPIEPPASAEHAPPVTHEPPPTTAEPAPAPTPVMMRIVLVVTPGSASIVLDEGEPVTSPLDLELPADGRTHTLTASAPGYRSETLTFVDRPPAPRLALVRLGGGVHPPGGGAATTTSQDDDIRTQR